MCGGPLAPHTATARPTGRHHRSAACVGARTGGLGRPKPRGQLGGCPPGAERIARAAAASSCEHRLAPARPLGDPCGTPRSAATRRSQPGSMKRGGNCTAMSHFPPCGGCGAVGGKRRICANKVDPGRQHCQRDASARRLQQPRPPLQAAASICPLRHGTLLFPTRAAATGSREHGGKRTARWQCRSHLGSLRCSVAKAARLSRSAITSLSVSTHPRPKSTHGC